MIYAESDSVELKREYTDDIRKEVVAFANANGGTLYIGIADDGTVVGVDDPDKTIQRVCNMLRDAVRPDITMFVTYSTLTEGERTVVVLRIRQGKGRPYYLASKGLRPEGVYVRQGTTAAPATETAIRAMIRDTDGDSYEERRSITQELTFIEAERRFARTGTEFGTNQMKTLGLIGSDGIYTNLGLLLSDQCPNIIKAASFASADPIDFVDRKEFSGSLFKQIDDAYDYLEMHNKLSSTFSGLYRNDMRDYPEAALREALLNAVTHRDYGISAATLLSVYEDRIEMVSIGGLVKGVELTDVMVGISVCRNPKLANVFYRLRLIEAYGTGMKKILSCYEGRADQPAFTVTPNAFKITLPRVTIEKEHTREEDDTERLLRLLKKKDGVGRAEIEKELSISPATAIRMLKAMIEEGTVERTGSGRMIRYRAKR